MIRGQLLGSTPTYQQSISLPADEWDRLDAWAMERKLGRSAAVRCAIRALWEREAGR